MRLKRILWFVAAAFVIACFLSGAWLGKTLSQLPPLASSGRPATEGTDQTALRREQRETAIATAIASPIAVLIVSLTVLAASGMLTKKAS